MPTPDIAIHANPDVLAAAVAARLVTKLVDLQAGGTTPKIVLTGGGTGTAVLEQLRATRRRLAMVGGFMIELSPLALFVFAAFPSVALGR